MEEAGELRVLVSAFPPMPDPDHDQNIPRLVQSVAQNICAIAEGDEELPVSGAFSHHGADVGIFLKAVDRIVDRQHSLPGC